jgi:hypothetical protein
VGKLPGQRYAPGRNTEGELMIDSISISGVVGLYGWPRSTFGLDLELIMMSKFLRKIHMKSVEDALRDQCDEDSE